MCLVAVTSVVFLAGLFRHDAKLLQYLNRCRRCLKTRVEFLSNAFDRESRHHPQQCKQAEAGWVGLGRVQQTLNGTDDCCIWTFNDLCEPRAITASPVPATKPEDPVGHAAHAKHQCDQSVQRKIRYTGSESGAVIEGPANSVHGHIVVSQTPDGGECVYRPR